LRQWLSVLIAPNLKKLNTSDFLYTPHVLISVEFVEISKKLQITDLANVKKFYWVGTALVFVGIWFMDLVFLFRKISIGNAKVKESL